MSEALLVVLAGVLGAGLGTVFYGGLWWTVRRGVSARQPMIWFLASLLARTALALAGFYAVGRGDWRRLAACLAGFILARMLVTRLTRPLPAPPRAVLNGGGG